MPKYLPPPHKFRPKTLDSTDTVDFTHFRRTVNRYCVFSAQGNVSISHMYTSCISFLTLKAPRKKTHLKMSSAEVFCCKYLTSVTDKLSIEKNSVDPEQTAPIGAV